MGSHERVYYSLGGVSIGQGLYIDSIGSSKKFLANFFRKRQSIQKVLIENNDVNTFLLKQITQQITQQRDTDRIVKHDQQR